MSEMDGLALARAIKADPTIASTRLIVLTSLGQSLTAGELKAMGINAYVSKPVKQSSLFDCLVNAMGKTAVDLVRTETSAITLTEEECPVDVQRLMEVGDDDPQQVRELVGLFLVQSEDFLKKLSAAILSGATKEVNQLAHQYLGVSAGCGMTAIVPPLQELEQMGRSGLLSGAEQSFANATNQFIRIRQFLTGYLQT
jgi:CheY-like chemotaxis protein